MSRKIEVIADDSTLLQEIADQQKHIDTLAEEVNERKNELKAAKEAWEEAVDRLGVIIRDSNRKLFNNLKDD